MHRYSALSSSSVLAFTKTVVKIRLSLHREVSVSARDTDCRNMYNPCLELDRGSHVLVVVLCLLRCNDDDDFTIKIMSA